LHPQKNANAETVAVLGASPKAHRYAYRALEMLRDYGHHAIPVNPAYDEILGEKCYSSITEIPGKVDTATLYIGKARSDLLTTKILEANPRRIIFNPGAENPELAARAKTRGIEVIVDCTLVMLRSGTF
jgi:predicted CoA-binding protein